MTARHEPSTASQDASGLRLGTRTGRLVLIACILGSGIAGIDSTVVSIALPAMGHDFGVGFASLQWTVTAYTITLASLILLGGSLGDRFGRRRIFVLGVVWFAIASCLCAAAPSASALIAARALQGVGGALLTPASLAIIQASFVDTDRPRAIGAWSGWSGTASAIAPFLGGWLIGLGTWRWVFLINPPLSVLVIVLALRYMPETRDSETQGLLDIPGAILGVICLGSLTYGIIAAAEHAVTSPAVLIPTAVGIVSLLLLLAVERRAAAPLLPLKLFRSRQFSAANAVTLLVYFAISGALFLLVIELQVVSGFSPLLAGTALLPITVIMLAFAARFGALAQRIGPRLQMSVGPMIAALGLTGCLLLGPNSSYLLGVLPPLTIFGLGLAVLVAPLTSTVLSAVPTEHAGVASGVNNAVARTAGLISIAALPVVTGLTGSSYSDPEAFLTSFRSAISICIALLVGGGVLAAVTIVNPRRVKAATEAARQPADIGNFCVLEAPPLRSSQATAAR